jgi:hypothetical protein
MYDEKQLAAVVILRVAIERITCKQLGHWDDGMANQAPLPIRPAVTPRARLPRQAFGGQAARVAPADLFACRHRSGCTR